MSPDSLISFSLIARYHCALSSTHERHLFTFRGDDDAEKVTIKTVANALCH
jgi:hypothetical protein